MKEWLDEMPWWIWGLLGVAGFLIRAFANKLPNSMQVVGLWGGLFVGTIAAACLIGYGIEEVRQMWRMSYHDIAIIVWLIVVAVGAAGLVVGFASKQLSLSAQAPSVKAVEPPELSRDEQAFRQELRHFASNCVPNLERGIYSVQRVLDDAILKLGIRDYTWSVLQLHNIARRGQGDIITEGRNWGTTPTEEIDADKLQDFIVRSIYRYSEELGTIANLNVLAKVDLMTLPEMQELIDGDKSCWSAMEKLRSWPEAQAADKLSKIDKDKFALNVANWTKPRATNFQPPNN